MSDNAELEPQDAVEETAVSGLTHEQALAELAKTRREAAKHRTEKQATKAALEELQRYKDSEKTELEKATERAAKAEQDLNELRREKAARAAAKAAGLDSELADLVKGDTEEELLESAKQLAARLEAKTSATGNFNAGNKAPVKPAESASVAFSNFLKNL